MKNDEATQIFRGVVLAAVGTTRKINDGSDMDGDEFIIENSTWNDIAEQLSRWFSEQHEGIVCTESFAKEFFEETYPKA